MPATATLTPPPSAAQPAAEPVPEERHDVALTPEMRAHAQRQVDAGRHASIEDYVRALVHRDRLKAETDRRLAELIQEGIDSGEPIEMTPDQLRDMMQAEIEAVRSR